MVQPYKLLVVQVTFLSRPKQNDIIATATLLVCQIFTLVSYNLWGQETSIVTYACMYIFCILIFLSSLF